MQVNKQQLEPDMEQWTGSKLGKQYIKAVYCHPAYLTNMQSTSCKTPSWMKHSWNQDCQEKNINNLRYVDDTTLMAESEELKSLLMKVKEESEKLALNSTFRKRRLWHPVPSLHVNRWGNSGNGVRLYFFVLQNHCRW